MAKHARYVLVVRWDGKSGKQQEFGTIAAETERDEFEQLLDMEIIPSFRERLMERLENLAMALAGDTFYEKHVLYRIDDSQIEDNKLHPDPENEEGKILRLHLIPVCTFKDGYPIQAEVREEPSDPPWIIAFGCSRGIDNPRQDRNRPW